MLYVYVFYSCFYKESSFSSGQLSADKWQEEKIVILPIHFPAGILLSWYFYTHPHCRVSDHVCEKIQMNQKPSIGQRSYMEASCSKEWCIEKELSTHTSCCLSSEYCLSPKQLLLVKLSLSAPLHMQLSWHIVRYENLCPPVFCTQRSSNVFLSVNKFFNIRIFAVLINCAT